jgi:nucleoside-diphosphate-sugar epimerase
MRVLVTGHRGYIGSLLTPMLAEQGHDVVGLDTRLYDDCLIGEDTPEIPALEIDVRDVEPHQVEGFDAVIHLAALCNDPLGDLNPEVTYDINHRASVRLALLARNAGVPRFLFSSSCSLYGAAGEAPIDESAPFNPVTPYGRSKGLAEQEIAALASDDFSPTFLRHATAYGVSPRLRGDLVVNNLVGLALTTGEVLIKSDGSPWRPLVHVEDIARAFVAALEAPREALHAKAFNVGATAENYQVRDVGDIVERVVPGSRVVYAEGGGPDARNYRVNCDAFPRAAPVFEPRWDVEGGARELLDAFRDHGLTLDDLNGSRFMRIRRVLELIDRGKIDASLRPRARSPRRAASAP